MRQILPIYLINKSFNTIHMYMILKKMEYLPGYAALNPLTEKKSCNELFFKNCSIFAQMIFFFLLITHWAHITVCLHKLLVWNFTNVLTHSIKHKKQPMVENKKDNLYTTNIKHLVHNSTTLSPLLYLLYEQYLTLDNAILHKIYISIFGMFKKFWHNVKNQD